MTSVALLLCVCMLNSFTGVRLLFGRGRVALSIPCLPTRRAPLCNAALLSAMRKCPCQARHPTKLGGRKLITDVTLLFTSWMGMDW